MDTIQIEGLDETPWHADEVSYCCFCLVEDLDETEQADDVSYCCFCLVED